MAIGKAHFELVIDTKEATSQIKELQRMVKDIKRQLNSMVKKAAAIKNKLK
jgi:hypothetical protein